ncbi:acyl-CoA reductase [Olivibacter sp. SDN3]|nr:acyl-CoA reductase [Olivibacter sp. SDN3]
MTTNKRIEAFSALGKYILEDTVSMTSLIDEAAHYNSWFTSENIKSSLTALANNLSVDKLSKWLESYPTVDIPTNKTVGLVLAGNIPMVGFHDILCVLITGFNVQIKLSSDDKILIPYLLKQLITFEPAFEGSINYTERLHNFDLIIATGSNNTARYFEYYFKHVPHIIRKNRNSIAVVHGDERPQELQQLGHDIFDYFGLGCRNVSKIYFPKNYAVSTFFEAIEPFISVINHHKYHNNYDYNKSIYLVNGDEHFDNGFLLLKEDERIASPLAVAYYQTYETLSDLINQLNKQENHIQCIVSNKTIKTKTPLFPLGHSQRPALNDYADGINTIDFLVQNK